MSNTLALQIDDFDLYTERKGVNPTVMSVYCEEEKSIVPLPLKQVSDVDEDQYEEEGPTHLVEYAVGAHAALDRLELMGFTLPAAKDDFVQSLAQEIESLDSWRERATTSSDSYKQLVDAREDAIRSLSFEKWLDGFRQIFE